MNHNLTYFFVTSRYFKIARTMPIRQYTQSTAPIMPSIQPIIGIPPKIALITPYTAETIKYTAIAITRLLTSVTS